ncbi:CvpA family protein [Salidesulfovibrio onnuriiensis]|uniref:CvpA family protein n=1 Tax=Salidesulfovibrio onnuriiensis TaxID=2583823 RepID=UPI0011CB4CBE|nr:CvpA family protein [Salidesulfovibrio onnuriiensis]
MNLLDIILIIVAALFLVRGFLRGFVKEVFSLASIGLAYFVASRYNYLLQPHLKLYIGNETTVWALSTVLIFVGILLICWIIAKLIREFLELALLGWLDRTAGAVFGAAEGVLIALLALLLMQNYFPNASFMQESTIVPYAQPALKALSDFEPSSIGKKLDELGLPDGEAVKKKADEAAEAIDETINGDPS